MDARDLSLPLRRAIITHLKGDTGVTAHVPEGRVYGMRQPATTQWPFTRYGSPDTRAAGLGSDTDIALHGFSKGPYEDECAEIMKALVTSLNGALLTLEDGEETIEARILWRRTQIIPDAAEANAWHGIAHFNARIDVCA
jgi:hypothetical protein